MDNNTPPPCPNTVTVRRNPPRRARATPQSSNFCDITPFPSDDILSAQTTQNQSTSENNNLKVFLRIRPAPSPNQAPRAKAKTAWPKNLPKKNTVAGVNTSKTKSFTTCISINDSQSLTLSVPSGLQESKRIKSETYSGFSHIFPSDSCQFEVYERMVKPMVDDFLKGKSGMLAALGPSGSGKTHTVFGCPRDPGMVSLALRHIFKETEQASRSFYIAIFEIYSERGKAEKLFDLLPDGGELFLQQSSVKGLKEVVISNAEQAESLIAQAVIKRATAMTNTNSQSSRSQCIINIRDVPQKCKGVVNPKSNDAVLTIIDLAGAEREKRTGNQGTRLLESNFINNTLMVFSLCLRSLLEHQKNPKKPLQKHFQNSMLTRYLRGYLEGKKRMTLLLTAKSGEDDYLDTSYLLRQASPYMQIKYNEVEPSNMVPKKRHYQASSIVDNFKQSPSIEHLKRMRLVNEHTTQPDVAQEVVVSPLPTKAQTQLEHWAFKYELPNVQHLDASSACNLDSSSFISLKSECDSRAGCERSHIIMQNFAKVIWNALKQYNSKMKVAEREISSLKESLGCEKEKYQALEMQFNEFRASCSCCKGGKVRNDTEDCSSVDLDYPHNLDQEASLSIQETLHAKSPFEPRIYQSEEEHLLGTTSGELDFENSDREVSVLSSELEHIALEVVVESKETFDTVSSSEPTLYQSDDEHMRGTTRKELDSVKSDREVSISSKPGQPIAKEVDAVSKIPSESFVTKSSSELRLDQSDDEQMQSTVCKELDSEKSEREVSVFSSKAMTPNTLEEAFHAQSTSEPILDLKNEEPLLCASFTLLDSEKSDRLVSGVSASSSKPADHNALEVNAVSKIPSELVVSSSLTKDDILDPSLPKEVLPTKTKSDAGVNNSGKPSRPKRILMPAKAMLSKDMSTFDFLDEIEKPKGNRSTRNVAAHDPQRSNGSISLLHLLKGRHSNLRR